MNTLFSKEFSVPFLAGLLLFQELPNRYIPVVYPIARRRLYDANLCVDKTGFEREIHNEILIKI